MEYGHMTTLLGTAAQDKALAWDLIGMGACIALGGVAFRLVQLWRDDRRRNRIRMMKDTLRRLREERDR